MGSLAYKYSYLRLNGRVRKKWGVDEAYFSQLAKLSTRYQLIQGAIVNRNYKSYGIDKNLYIYPFLLTTLGPINYSPS